MEAGIESADAFLRTVDLERDRLVRSFDLAELHSEDVVEMRSDVDPATAIGVAIAANSPWPIELHARLMTESDQTPAEPTAERYVREFLDPTDPSCFPDASCGLLKTSNDVRRSNPLYTLDFILWKDFRWIRVLEGGEDSGRTSFLARSFVAERTLGENGTTEMVQSYTVDLWVQTPDDEVRRIQTLHSEVNIPGISDPDLIRGTIIYSIDQAFKAADDTIEEAYTE